MIETEETRSGLLTIKYDNKYIHSKYDPMREAHQLIEANIKLVSKEIIVVYGLGLGYHVDVLLEKINSQVKVYVFEYNMSLIECCAKINNKVFQYKNVNIIGSNDNEFYEKLAKYLGKAGDILIHRPSLETIKLSNESLYNLIDDYSLIKQSDEYNEQLIRLGKENYEINIKQNYKRINEFIDLHKDSAKPYIITASGPSLDGELELLKANREKFNIISVGSSLRALMEKNIRPDAVVISDGKEGVRKQFTGYENENIPLCFYAKASRWAVSDYKGPKFIFNATNCESEINIATEGTVAVSAIDIAVKCKAKKIIFLGQDLAFVNDKSHTEVFEKTYGYRDEYANRNKIRTVKSVDGSRINTAQGYIRFKFKIERLIRKNPYVEFINCSKGAFIEGAEHCKLENVINEL